VAYLARLVIHRYAMLGVLDEEGHPLRSMGVLETSTDRPERSRVMAGKVCLECGNATVIHRDGCDFCTACGEVGQCG
jgi:ribonucleoside-diphosphate reductase alpha chain